MTDRATEEGREVSQLARDTARVLEAHMIRCEAGADTIARDIKDLRKDVCQAHAQITKELLAQTATMAKIIKWGGGAIILVIIVQVVGLEDAIGIVKWVRSMKP